MADSVESDAVSFGSDAATCGPDSGQPRTGGGDSCSQQTPGCSWQSRTSDSSQDCRPPSGSPADSRTPSTHERGCVVISGSSNIHVGSNLRLLVEPKPARQRPPPVTPAVCGLFRCPVEVTDRQILVASRYMGTSWRDVARRLGFLGGETDEFEYRVDSLREVCFRMLMTWREKMSAAATTENLAKALWDEQVYDVIFKLAEDSQS